MKCPLCEPADQIRCHCGFPGRLNVQQRSPRRLDRPVPEHRRLSLDVNDVAWHVHRLIALDRATMTGADGHPLPRYAIVRTRASGASRSPLARPARISLALVESRNVITKSRTVISRARAGHARPTAQLTACCGRLNRFGSFRMGGNGFDHLPGQVCRLAVTGTTPARPRRVSACPCDEAPPCMRWRGLAFAPGPWPPDCSGAERLAATTSVRFWLSAPVARPFPRRPRFPWDLNPSSVVRNFYCQPPPLHKAFPPSLQDSFVVHRTSAVYPLCTVPFHWPMHRSVHNLCGQPAAWSLRVQRSEYRQPAQKRGRGWPARLETSVTSQQKDKRCRQTHSRPTRPRPGTATGPGSGP